MSTAIANLEVRSYLDAVRAHLSDISERELDDLLEDLEGHLLEVAAEGEGSLEERLGPPEVYAEELRVSADLPPRDPAARKRMLRRASERFERSAIGRLVDTASRSTVAGELRTFLPELRPGWWVFRGYLAAWAPATLASGWYGRGSGILVPYVAGSYAAGLIVAAAAIWVSITLGRSGTTNKNRRRTSLVVSAAVIVATFAAVAQLDSTYQGGGYDEIGYSSMPYLHHADGTAISNICPYSTDGKPLSGVLLYDQDGRAIIDIYPQSNFGNPLLEQQPAIRNAFPRNLFVPDPNTGEPKQLSCPTIPTQPPAPPAGPQPSTPGTPGG